MNLLHCYSRIPNLRQDLPQISRSATIKMAAPELADAESAVRSNLALMPTSGCGHLPLRALSQIATAVREVTGLNSQVF